MRNLLPILLFTFIFKRIGKFLYAGTGTNMLLQPSDVAVIPSSTTSGELASGTPTHLCSLQKSSPIENWHYLILITAVTSFMESGLTQVYSVIKAMRYVPINKNKF